MSPLADLHSAVERSLAEDRAALAGELRRLVEKHVGLDGVTPAAVKKIMAEYDQLRVARYGTRKGDTRGSLYALVADSAREGWLEAVDAQARHARKLISEAG